MTSAAPYPSPGASVAPSDGSAHLAAGLRGGRRRRAAGALRLGSGGHPAGSGARAGEPAAADGPGPPDVAGRGQLEGEPAAHGPGLQVLLPHTDQAEQLRRTVVGRTVQFKCYFVLERGLAKRFGLAVCASLRSFLTERLCLTRLTTT